MLIYWRRSIRSCGNFGPCPGWRVAGAFYGVLLGPSITSLTLPEVETLGSSVGSNPLDSSYFHDDIAILGAYPLVI